MSKPILLKDLSPAQGDKYSQSLYNYLRRSGRFHTDEVFRDNRGRYWFGTLNRRESTFTGVCLDRVLYAMPGAQKRATYPTSTKEWSLCSIHTFWARYRRIGVCLFDRQHRHLWQRGNSRFRQTHKTRRTCQWCGQHQRLITRKVVTKEQAWIKA